MGNIIKVNDRTKLCSQLILCSRCYVGRKHDFIFFKSHRIGKHQLRVRRAVASAVIFTQHFDQCRVWVRFHCKILTKSRIPGKSFLYRFRILTNSFFIVNVKRSWYCCCDFFQFFFCYKRLLRHSLLSPSSAYFA